MAKSNVWMSVSDLMTGLMVIFLFIAIAYMNRVKKNQSVLVDYVDTKTKLHDKLVKEFENDTSRWNMAIGRDLTMKFQKPEVLFGRGDYQLTSDFKNILKKFIPRYLDILLNDTLMNSKIKEIRVEGHTDTVPAPQYDRDPYLGNIILSQKRAFEVLKYIRSLDAFKNYTDEERRQLEYWFSANGLSYGKALDKNGEYTFISKLPINPEKSRRVEFRIITEGEEMLEEFVKKNDLTN